MIIDAEEDTAAAWAIDIPEAVLVVSDHNRAVFNAFRVRRAPFVVGLDSTGTCIAKGTLPVDLDARRSMQRYSELLKSPDEELTPTRVGAA